jgi:SAM-dependent methyltransferase
VIVDSEVVARKRARWLGRANVERFVEETDAAYGPQRLKNAVETDIVRRFMCGERLLDVGIGTGRVSLPLLQNGLRLTGVDTSAAMIERCSSDARATAVRLVQGEFERLPFAAQAFDTTISVDAFAHFPDWAANLDELLRVTRIGGRIIVDVGSRDHIEAVAQRRGCTSDEVRVAELGAADAYTLRLSCAELRAYAAERNISLVALVPCGAVFGALVPNYWIAESYSFRSGGIDRLVSWIGVDPLLFAFAEFIERRVVQQLPPSVSGRMFAVFERLPGADAYREPLVTEIAAGDERGPGVWRAEFAAHVQHAPNRSFAVAFLLTARPMRLPVDARGELPALLLEELERVERAASIDDICAEFVTAWGSAVNDLTFHGVDLSPVFAHPLQRELRDRLDAGG